MLTFPKVTPIICVCMKLRPLKHHLLDQGFFLTSGPELAGQLEPQRSPRREAAGQRRSESRQQRGLGLAQRTEARLSKDRELKEAARR